MSKKLSILAAAHHLGAFTVAELADRAGAPASTVQTVLNRAPQDWFGKKQLASGTRGGQPLSYELSDEGRRAIERSLEAVNVVPRLAPAQPPFERPFGLTSALENLRQLADAPPDVAKGLREDALGNLKWAEAELEDGAFAEHASELRALIAHTRKQLGVPAVEIFTQEAKSEDASTSSWAKESVIGIARRQMDYWGRVIAGSFARKTAVRRHAPVFISYLDLNEGAKQLATFAQGALSGASFVQAKPAGFELVVHQLTMQHLKEQLAQTAATPAARDLDVLVCFNSESSTPEVIRAALEQLMKTHATNTTVLLDQGFSPAVESFARDHSVSYEPNATQPNRMGWIQQAISGFQAGV